MYYKLNRNSIVDCRRLCSTLFAGSSGSVQYSSLSPGSYNLCVVARAVNGEREIERRKFHIGMYTFCTHGKLHTPKASTHNEPLKMSCVSVLS